MIWRGEAWACARSRNRSTHDLGWPAHLSRVRSAWAVRARPHSRAHQGWIDSRGCAGTQGGPQACGHGGGPAQSSSETATETRIETATVTAARLGKTMIVALA